MAKKQSKLEKEVIELRAKLAKLEPKAVAFEELIKAISEKMESEISRMVQEEIDIAIDDLQISR